MIHVLWSLSNFRGFHLGLAEPQMSRNIVSIGNVQTEEPMKVFFTLEPQSFRFRNK